MKFQRGSKGTSFQASLVPNEYHKQKLISQLRKPDEEILELAFRNHCEKLVFNGDSGLCPYMILSLHCYIDRISPLLLDESDSDTAPAYE